MLCLDWVHVHEQDKRLTWSNIYAETKLSTEPTAIFDAQKWYVCDISVICTFAYFSGMQTVLYALLCSYYSNTQSYFPFSQVQGQQISPGYAAVSQEEKPG